MNKEDFNAGIDAIYKLLASIDNKLDSCIYLSGLLMVANNDLVPKEQRLQALNRAMNQLGMEQIPTESKENDLPTDMIR